MLIRWGGCRGGGDPVWGRNVSIVVGQEWIESRRCAHIYYGVLPLHANLEIGSLHLHYYILAPQVPWYSHCNVKVLYCLRPFVG